MIIIYKTYIIYDNTSYLIIHHIWYMFSKHYLGFQDFLNKFTQLFQ